MHHTLGLLQIPLTTTFPGDERTGTGDRFYLHNACNVKTRLQQPTTITAGENV